MNTLLLIISSIAMIVLWLAAIVMIARIKSKNKNNGLSSNE